MWVQRWGEVEVMVIGYVVIGDCPEMAVACADEGDQTSMRSCLELLAVFSVYFCAS